MENLTKNNLLQFCPTRQQKGRPPKFTASGIDTKESKRWKGWHKATTQPNAETSRMIAHALSITLRITLQNHVCTFNNKMYKQLSGGAIGVGIAGDVANLFMVWWDRQLQKRCQEQQIHLKLYARYVDDINIVTKKPAQSEKDQDVMELIQHIGNSIHPSIRLTIDYPSKHEDSRLPVLDLKEWISDVEVDGERKSQILTTFYMKPMASRFVVRADTAMDER